MSPATPTPRRWRCGAPTPNDSTPAWRGAQAELRTLVDSDLGSVARAPWARPAATAGLTAAAKLLQWLLPESAWDDTWGDQHHADVYLPAAAVMLRALGLPPTEAMARLLALTPGRLEKLDEPLAAPPRMPFAGLPMELFALAMTAARPEQGRLLVRTMYLLGDLETKHSEVERGRCSSR